ncbi:MAG: hypothetical protein ACUVT9_04370 [Candidatus Bathycorpusculaceae bacterium]
MDLLAAKTTELLTLAQTTNATAETFVQMPTTIGDKQYWLQLSNDTARAWVEGGFGDVPQKATELRVYIQRGVLASGCYVATYGAAHLTCQVDGEIAKVTLTSFVEGR